jgi:hypothetical protein
MNQNLLPGERFLMPHQSEPFNGDIHMCQKFLELKKIFNIDTAIELGTCVGGTTKWLSENFDKVIGIELMPEFLNFAKQRANSSNVEFHLGSTVDLLPEVLKGIKDNTIFHIDSHWGDNNPLLRELEIIAEFKLKPVIEIHDFKVPGHPELGFDTYEKEGIVYEWAWIESYIEAIYGKNGFQIEYNYQAIGAKRGCIYIYPLV